MNSIEPELISVKTLGALLDVPEKTIRTWIYQRRVPYHKIGALVRFKLKEIRAWYEAGRVSALSEEAARERLF